MMDQMQAGGEQAGVKGQGARPQDQGYGVCTWLDRANRAPRLKPFCSSGFGGGRMVRPLARVPQTRHATASSSTRSWQWQALARHVQGEV
jgi:hypothetical protein